MISWDSPIIVGIIGFIGGILGGLIVNILSIKYQKNMDRKIEEEKAETEYFNTLNALLNEIIESWEKELTKDHVDIERVQNDFDIYSRQLTSLISRAPQKFSTEIKLKLKELSSSLAKISTLTLTNTNCIFFSGNVEKIITFAREIRESLK